MSFYCSAHTKTSKEIEEEIEHNHQSDLESESFGYNISALAKSELLYERRKYFEDLFRNALALLSQIQTSKSSSEALEQIEYYQQQLLNWSERERQKNLPESERELVELEVHTIQVCLKFIKLVALKDQIQGNIQKTVRESSTRNSQKKVDNPDNLSSVLPPQEMQVIGCCRNMLNKVVARTYR